jgi:hypothetical protein
MSGFKKYMKNVRTKEIKYKTGSCIVHFISDDRGFESRQVLGIFLFTTAASRPALGPTQPPTQWVPGALSLGVKLPEREADHSPPSSAEVKECMELHLHSLIRLRGVVLS